MLTIYGRKSSFNVQKVMWLVGELEIDHKHIEKGGSFGGLDDAAFQKMNPHSRVPVIEDNGVIVWESHAILRYLAATRGAGSFWFNTPKERALVDQWLDWSQCTLQPDFLNGIFWGYYRTPEEQRDMTRVHQKVRLVTHHMERLDVEIGDKAFLLGNYLSLADIAIGTNFYRYFEIDDIDKPAVPNVRRWYASLRKRTAYQAGVMIPFEDLYGRLDY